MGGSCALQCENGWIECQRWKASSRHLVNRKNKACGKVHEKLQAVCQNCWRQKTEAVAKGNSDSRAVGCLGLEHTRSHDGRESQEEGTG